MRVTQIPERPPCLVETSGQRSDFSEYVLANLSSTSVRSRCVKSRCPLDPWSHTKIIWPQEDWARNLVGRLGWPLLVLPKPVDYQQLCQPLKFGLLQTDQAQQFCASYSPAQGVTATTKKIELRKMSWKWVCAPELWLAFLFGQTCWCSVGNDRSGFGE